MHLTLPTATVLTQLFCFLAAIDFYAVLDSYTSTPLNDPVIFHQVVVNSGSGWVYWAKNTKKQHVEPRQPVCFWFSTLCMKGSQSHSPRKDRQLKELNFKHLLMYLALCLPCSKCNISAVSLWMENVNDRTAQYSQVTGEASTAVNFRCFVLQMQKFYLQTSIPRKVKFWLFLVKQLPHCPDHRHYEHVTLGNLRI